jgi:hypothetical protein
VTAVAAGAVACTAPAPFDDGAREDEPMNPHPGEEAGRKHHAMTEAKTLPTIPDRLSVDPRSPHHVAAVFEHQVGIRLNGKERVDVEEYCVSEGWVKVPAGKALDRKGNPMMITLKGKVEAFYK